MPCAAPPLHTRRAKGASVATATDLGDIVKPELRAASANDMAAATAPSARGNLVFPAKACGTSSTWTSPVHELHGRL